MASVNPVRTSASLVGLVIVLAVAGRASAAEPEVSQASGLITISASGALPEAAPPGSLTARLRRGERTDLEAAVTRDGAAWQVRLRTGRLLQPGAYTLEVVDGAGEVRVRQAVRIGDVAAQAEAEARLLGWYRNAAGTLRGLAAGLERRGAFHRARAAAAEAQGDRVAAAAERAAFSEDFFPRWELSLRTARMDLATYQRRVVLPSRPHVGEALVALVPLLSGRARLWRQAFEDGAPAPPPPTGLLEAVRALARGLGRDATWVQGWEAGPLATPPPAAAAGTEHHDPLGFTLAIPAGSELATPPSPEVRLLFGLGEARVLVRVDVLPDQATAAAQAAQLEIRAWETWESYKRLRGAPLRAGDRAGVRLEFLARMPFVAQDRRTAERALAQVVQRTWLVPERRLAISLVVLWGEGRPAPEALEALEASFAVSEAR